MAYSQEDGTAKYSPESSKEEKELFHNFLNTSNDPIAVKLRGYKSAHSDECSDSKNKGM